MNDNKIDPYGITKSVVYNSSATMDVFLNEFDITWAREDKYSNSTNRNLTVTPIEVAQPSFTGDDGSIIYNYNNEWFRSDDFTKTHDEKYHVLFGGCSESEGIASPLEEVWTKMLHEELKTKYDVGGFYSIARAGYGWQKVISSFMIYVKKYGFPTHFIVLLPNIGRFFEWKDDQDAWFYMQRFPLSASGESRNDEFSERSSNRIEHKRFLIDFIAGWKLFVEYCKSNNVKLIWSTWDYGDSHNFQLFNEPGQFFCINDNHYDEDFILSKRPDGKLLDGDLFRRDGHSGRLKHLFWKEHFKNEIERLELFHD